MASVTHMSLCGSSVMKSLAVAGLVVCCGAPRLAAEIVDNGVPCANIKGPVLLHKASPKRVAGAKGVVITELTVGVKGRVEAVRLLHGFQPEADTAALEASLRWRFVPAECGGAVVAVPYVVTFHFPPTEGTRPAQPGVVSPPKSSN